MLPHTTVHFLLLIIFLFPRGNCQKGLTFAENVFVKLSGACRALVDLQFSSMNNQNDQVKTIKIVYLDGNETKYFPVNEAYVSLTQHSTFDISKETKIIIHGFKDSSQSAVPLDLAQAYNEKNMFNVLQVDAEELLSEWYIYSVHNARLVGKRLANLLANLDGYGTNPEDIHLLGISLGAHVAGWAGKYFKQYKMRSIGRITGLDPAGPCFTYTYSDQRLDKLDAKFVDVVHTNRLVQGVIEPLGHADFYLNGGGPSQPGCSNPSCSHLRAAEVYTESIRNPQSLVGIKCNNWKKFMVNACNKNDVAVLGYGCSTKTRGVYYLRTNGASPFGLGMSGTKTAKKRPKSPMENWLTSLNLT